MSNILAEGMHSYTTLTLPPPPSTLPLPPYYSDIQRVDKFYSIDLSLHQETFCQHLIKVPSLFQRTDHAGVHLQTLIG